MNPFFMSMFLGAGPIVGALVALAMQSHDDPYDHIEAFMSGQDRFDEETAAQHDAWIDSHMGTIKMYRDQYIAVDVNKDIVVGSGKTIRALVEQLDEVPHASRQQLLIFHTGVFLGEYHG
jgi:hypothetical protein